jgi:hypothetical protein
MLHIFSDAVSTRGVTRRRIRCRIMISYTIQKTAAGKAATPNSHEVSEENYENSSG